MTFNPNEILLERIRSVEEFDIETKELKARYTQIESPSLSLTAENRTVTDARGAEIATFYDAQSGTFTFTNSIHSLDLIASQFGSEKEIASEENKIGVPVSETLTIGADHTVVLTYVPVGVEGAEVKYVKVINDKNEFGETYEVSPTAGDGKFTINADTKTITLPDDVTGKVFVTYEKEASEAVKISKTTEDVPEVRSLNIHAIFRDKCNKNIVYAGVIVVHRAQIDPTSVELNLTSDGKHSVSYRLQSNICEEPSKLVDIIVSKD